jgi:hypothetical protein
MQITVALDGEKKRDLRFFAGDDMSLTIVVYAHDGDTSPITVTNVRFAAADGELPMDSEFVVPSNFFGRVNYRIVGEVEDITTTLCYGVMQTEGEWPTLFCGCYGSPWPYGIVGKAENITLLDAGNYFDHPTNVEVAIQHLASTFGGEAAQEAAESSSEALAYRNEAQAASATAVAAADTSVANATVTTTKAAEASASATAAASSEVNAAISEQNAFDSSGLFVDLAAFDAAVADGKLGGIKSADVNTAYDIAEKVAGTASLTGKGLPSKAYVEAVRNDLDARAPVSAASRFSHLLTDSLGHAAGRLWPDGTLELLASEMQELTLQTMNLTPDARGTILQVDDSQGHVAWRIKEDGTVESTPSLRVYDGTTLVSGQVGGIEFGDNLTVSTTTRGVKVDASGGGSTEAGSLSSLNQGVTKLDDPATWVDRTLVLQAGASLTVGLSGSASVLGFRVVKMTHLEAPIAPYYAYYSTDHAAGEGGVFLATASHPFGPWTPQGRVFYDASATQTETPEVVWDRHSGLYRLYYQVQNAKYGPGDSISAIGSQSTLSAYSTDGVTWTKDPNFILDHLASYQYADGHTGYFYISETPDGFVGRSALGGGSIGLTTLWRHQGGTMGGLLKNTHIHNNWYSDFRDVGSNYEATYGTPQEGRRAIPFGAFGYNLRGARMGIGQCWYRRSGTEPADVIVVAGPITNDYRRFIGMPTPIWTPEEAWETEDVRFTNTFVDDGYIYVFLTMNNSGVPTASANVIGGFRHVV